MGNFKYTNAMTRTTYDDYTDRFINESFKTEQIKVKNPTDSGERTIQFIDKNDNLAAYLFFHAAGNGTVGLYDARYPRAILRTELRSEELRFGKHLVPELALNLGSSSKKWSKVYATTGTIQTSDEKMKENIKPINAEVKAAGDDVLQGKDFLKFIENANFVTYDWKDKEVAAQGLEKQIGFIAQEVCKDKVGSLIATEKEYSMTNLVMAMGIAMQEMAKEIKELKTNK